MFQLRVQEGPRLLGRMSGVEWTSSYVFRLEIVAVITNSLRLSKQVSQIVRRIRESTIPSVKEASGWSWKSWCQTTRKVSGICTHMIYSAL